jgi:hypothetical protein
MSQTALKCKKCSAIWTPQTIFNDACPECEGEIVDITNTRVGQQFLSIIGMPDEIRTTSKHNIYATGPSFLLGGNS